MLVKDMIKLAKQGDDTGFDYLKSHYEPIIKENVRRKFGDDASEKMVELLPSLIKYYFDNNFKYRLDDFLNRKANTLFSEKEKRIIIGGKIDSEDEEKIKRVVNHYSNHFYQKIKKYNKILSDEELREFSYILIKTNVLKLMNNNTYIRNLMLNYIMREVEVYKNDEEKMMKRFVLVNGINDNILKYFTEKYSYLLEEYKADRMYNCLKSYYKEIIIESLEMITRIDCKLEKIIMKNLYKKYENEKIKEQKFIDNKIVSKESFKCIYENYSYIKDIIYNKFINKTIFTDEELILEIDKKYIDYVNAYLNGTMDSNVQRYINARLTDYFKSGVRTIPEKIFYKTDDYYYYSYYIDKYLDKLQANYPRNLALEELKNLYDEIFNKHYIKQRKTNIMIIIQKVLKQRIDYLNSSYQEQDIKNIASYYKNIISNEAIPKEIINNIIDNLTSYYISNGSNNKETFESLIINSILRYDKTIYEDLDMVKQQAQGKVLKIKTS